MLPNFFVLLTNFICIGKIGAKLLKEILNYGVYLS